MKIAGGIFGLICLICIIGILYFIGSTAIAVYNDPRSVAEQIGAFGGDVVNGFENSTDSQ